MATDSTSIGNNTQRKLNKEKLLEIEQERADLDQKWVVIYNGNLLANFETHDEAIDFAL